jgi:hypothetical protein
MAVPKGAVPTYALHGRPAVHARLAFYDGARIAAPSAPYVGRGNKCSANEDTCEAMRAKGTEFCVGHLRSVGKDTEVEDAADTADEN